MREVALAAPAADCWDALRDFGRPHERLVQGFLREAELIGPGRRKVTFFNGAVVSEDLVAVDDDRSRLAYTVTDGLPGCTHYGASAQIVPDAGGTCRFVWIVDVLPDELGPRIAAMMDRGILAAEQTLNGSDRTGVPR